ncbi:Dual specificity protein phosphatase 8, partial [Ophiophagus hannah]
MLLLQVEAEKQQDVVVYDQSTRDVNGLATDSFLSILLGKLDSCFHSVSILTVEEPHFQCLMKACKGQGQGGDGVAQGGVVTEKAHLDPTT